MENRGMANEVSPAKEIDENAKGKRGWIRRLLKNFRQIPGAVESRSASNVAHRRATYVFVFPLTGARQSRTSFDRVRSPGV